MIGLSVRLCIFSGGYCLPSLSRESPIYMAQLIHDPLMFTPSYPS